MADTDTHGGRYSDEQYRSDGPIFDDAIPGPGQDNRWDMLADSSAPFGVIAYFDNGAVRNIGSDRSIELRTGYSGNPAGDDRGNKQPGG